MRTFDGIDFIHLPSGSFSMGLEDGSEDENYVHEVRISKGFWMGKYEITQAQWQSVMGNNPSKFQDGDNHPVENVSWTDVQKFIQKLNENSPDCKKSLDSVQVFQKRNESEPSPVSGCYRLPTEAEWEYAAKAGTTTNFWTGDVITTKHANYIATEGHHSDVTSLLPNPWGFHDMNGNVAEWVIDRFHPNTYKDCPSPCIDPAIIERYTPGASFDGPYDALRVIRGGTFGSYEKYIRSGARWRFPRLSAADSVGFRLVKEK